MQRIPTIATIKPDGTLTAHLPDVPPGRHSIIVEIETAMPAPATPLAEWFPFHDIGIWPENSSLRRKDIYGDNGR